ncbi:MAG: DUF2934 domain-containing protein [Nitrospirae bacterium]|nr:DUF2934 domain-containing protein [Nitrospirota bacterium]
MKLYEEIAKTAHDLYVKSGHVPGRDLENWVEAERIVKSRYEAEERSKKNPGVTAVEPAVKKAVPAIVKETAAPKKAAPTKKTPAKRTAKTKKSE